MAQESGPTQRCGATYGTPAISCSDSTYSLAPTNASVVLTVTPVADIVNDTVAGTEDTPVTFNPITGTGEVSGADNFESSGRTDFPGGSHSGLIRSIREKLFILPDDVIVFPGHGPQTTIGLEKSNNPFLR